MRNSLFLLPILVVFNSSILFAQSRPDIQFSYQIHDLSRLISLTKDFSTRDYCYNNTTGILYIRKNINDSIVYMVQIAEKYEFSDSLLFPYTTQEDIFSTFILYQDCLYFLCSSPPSIEYGMKVYAINHLSEPIYEYKYDLIRPPYFDLCPILTKDSIVLMDIRESSISVGYVSKELIITPNQAMFSLKPAEGLNSLPEVRPPGISFSFYAMVADQIYLITQRRGSLTMIDQNGEVCLSIAIPNTISGVKLIHKGLTWFNEGKFYVFELRD
jgi:hypothetical protein